MIVVDSFGLDVPKTKSFQAILDQVGVIGTALVVVGGEDRNVELAARNLPLVGLAVATTVNTYELLRYDKLVFTKDAFAQVEARLAR